MNVKKYSFQALESLSRMLNMLKLAINLCLCDRLATHNDEAIIIIRNQLKFISS